MCSAMASRDDDSISRIEKFDGQNFHIWKFKMQMVLEDKDLRHSKRRRGRTFGTMVYR